MAVWHRPVTTILCTYTSSKNEAHKDTYTILSSLVYTYTYHIYVCVMFSLFFSLCVYTYIIYLYIIHNIIIIHTSHIYIYIYHTYVRTYTLCILYPDFRRETQTIISTDDLNIAAIEYNELINYWKTGIVSRKIG